MNPSNSKALIRIQTKLKEISVFIEGYIFPDVEVSDCLGEGNSNAVFSIAKQEDYVVRCQQTSSIEAENYQSDILSSAFLRAIPTNPFLDIPLLIQLRNEQEIRVKSINKRAGGSLEAYLKEIVTLDQVKHITAQIVLGLHELHCRGIAHRDLKPGNILVTKKIEESKWLGIFKQRQIVFDVKITDFDSMFLDSQNVEGTLIYFSPALRYTYNTSNKKFDSKRDTCPDDIWALGMILLDMICESAGSERIDMLFSAKLQQILQTVNDLYNLSASEMEALQIKWNKVVERFINRYIKDQFVEDDELKSFVVSLLNFSETDRPNLLKIINESRFLQTNIAKLSQQRAYEINEDVLPFWTLAQKIRNLANNLKMIALGELPVMIATQQTDQSGNAQENSELEQIKLGLSCAVQQIISLINDIPPVYLQHAALRSWLEALLEEMILNPMPHLLNQPAEEIMQNPMIYLLDKSAQDSITVKLAEIRQLANREYDDCQAFIAVFFSIVAELKSWMNELEDESAIALPVVSALFQLLDAPAGLENNRNQPVFIDKFKEKAEQAEASASSLFFSEQRLSQLKSIENYYRFLPEILTNRSDVLQVRINDAKIKLGYNS